MNGNGICTKSAAIVLASWILCLTSNLYAHERTSTPTKNFEATSPISPDGCASMIIFSFDRAMQLYALLESTEKYVAGLRDVFLLYRTSSPEHEAAYQEVFKRFKNFNMTVLKQGPKPREDFKSLLMQSLAQSNSPYVIFAVDDIIVRDYINLNFCAQAMEKYGAYGFYSRLGKNITHCHSANIPAPVPPLEEVCPDVYAWHFCDGTGDWGYPNSVDMVLLRTKTVLDDIINLPFSSPNTFEGTWASHSQRETCGICFGRCQIVNVVANRVQQDGGTRHMNSYNAQELLTRFRMGQKIDITPLKDLANEAPHVEYLYTFLDRRENTI